MSVNETARTTVLVNNEEAKLALEELQAELKKIKQLRKEAFEKGNTSAFEMYDKQFKKIGTEAARMKKEIQSVESVLRNLNGASPNELTAAFRNLQKQMNNTSRTDPRFNELKAQAKVLKAEINALNNEFREQPSFLSKAGDVFNKYFGIITAGAASMAGLILAGRKAIDEFNKFDDKVADVRKTTGLTKDEVIELDKALQDVNTRTAQNDLLGLAEVAGKIGISGVENVEGFVRAADKINVALSKDLGGNAEAAINDIGKLTDIFKLKDEFGIEQSMLKVGSAINSLGAASSASEAYLVEFTKRMAGVAPAANIPIESVLGLGATLDMLGQTSEISSTTVSAVWTDMFKNTTQYANIAGMSVSEFDNLLKTDANEAFLKFLEGLNGNNAGLGEMATKLDGLGLEGKRAISVLGVLSNNTEVLRTQQSLSSDEFKKGTSLINEFNIKNETSQAKLEKAQKQMSIYRRELGEKLQPAMTGVVSSGTMFMKVLAGMVELLSKHGTEILLVAGAIATYTIALRLKNTESKLSIALTKVKTIGEAAYSTTIGVLTGKIKIATIAQKLWNSVIAMNPAGAILAVVLLLTAGIVALVKAMNSQTVAQKAVKDVTEQAKRDIIEQKNKTEDLLAIAKDEKKSLEERKAALAELNKISPEYFGNLSIEKSTTEELTKAGEDYIANLEKQALVKAAQAKIDDLRTENANKEIDIQTKKKKWWETEEGAAKRRTKAINENKEAIVALQDIVDQNTDKTTTVTNKVVTNETTTTTGGGINTNDAKKKEQKEAFNNLEIAQRKEANLLKQKLLDKKLSEDEYNSQSIAKELEFLVRKQELQKKYGEDTTDTEAAILDKKLKAQEDADKKSADQKKKEQEKALTNLENQQEAELNIIKQQLADGLIEEDVAEQLLLQKEIEFLNRKIALKKQYGEDTAELEGQVLDKTLKIAENAAKGQADQEKALAEIRQKYADEEVVRKQELAAELAELDAVTKNGQLVSQEEYEKLKSAIHEKYEKNRYETTQKYLEGASNILGILSNLNNAAKDRELKKAGDNAAKKEAIEKKYAKKSQKIAIAQAVVNGALAVTKILAETPKADFGIMTAILIAGAIATTAAEVAAISNQQFKTGGYTSPSASDSTPVGVVHANEWVASAPLLRNPETRRHIDYLEAVQRNISPRFNTAAISSASRGFQAGGFSPESGTSTTQTVVMQQSDPALLAVMQQNAELLAHLKQNGVKSNINTREIFKAENDFQSTIRASEY